ncbi:class I SAM-dependent methyltransferase [Echinicola jeungdonensis]|uniref:Class I SAM-dependent methyltransferase n=1 Tax=Echinicola jeungdonensis TaxID=709343 RepID=A0ABV5J945_9BACT|nr:class I SAM-dependent methyltransferase [Echinicola jeungdonensis]MDN3670139.1 class I SAM-dependent methyltransferase [Echinicola jeungdonensis]
MKKPKDQEELQQIANQLAHPKGEEGLEISKLMHQTNISMTEKAIELLKLENDDSILELGHGNGHHVVELLENIPSLKYYGLEISELMHQEAKKANINHLENGQAKFHLYGGDKIPFEKESFDKILTVNTIYFWKEPLKMAQEIHRVLNTGGRFTVAFSQKHFLEKLPFAQYGFTFYDNEMVEELMEAANFTIVEQSEITETVKSKAMEEIEREFTVMAFQKQ